MIWRGRCGIMAAALLAGLLAVAGTPASLAQEITAAQVQAGLPGLETLAKEALLRTGVPGAAVAVVYQDKVVYLKGFGTRTAGGKDAVDADTVFDLSSIAKPILATVVAGLVGDGVVGWDDKIADLDPGFALQDDLASRDLTVRDLLSHRSGLPEYAGDLLKDLGFDRATILQKLRYVRPASSLRARFAFCNYCYAEGILAAVKPTGKPWEQVAAERLYKPAGMAATSSRHADFGAAANRAIGHLRVEGVWTPATGFNDDPASGADVSSTARDVARWMRLELGGGRLDGKQLVAAEALAETQRPQIVADPPKDPATNRAGFYGLGWDINYDDRGRVMLSHSGASAAGVATAVYLLPGEGLGIVVLTNAFPVGVPEAIGVGFLDLLAHGSLQRDWIEVFGQAFADLIASLWHPAADYARSPANASPALAEDAYAGTYANDLFGEIEVAAVAGGLELRLGPRKKPYALKHWDRDAFTYQPTGEYAFGPSGVWFTIGPQGQATSVVIEQLNGNGQGRFGRVMVAK